MENKKKNNVKRKSKSKKLTLEELQNIKENQQVLDMYIEEID